MKTVINLNGKDEYQYGDNVPDMVAVCQTYCINNNLSSWFYSMLYNKLRFIDSLPVTIGNRAIACGDYCILKDGDMK